MKKTSKIFGWALLILGVVVIFWTLITSYNIFTSKTDTPQFFEAKEVVSVSAVDREDLSPEEMQGEMERIMGEQIREIIPTETIFALLNLISWSILAWIMIFGGGKIATIGIKLIIAKVDDGSGTGSN